MQSDEELVNENRRILSVLDGEILQIKVEALREKGWIAVPVRSSDHFSPEQAEVIASAIRKTFGDIRCVGIQLDDVYLVPPWIVVNADAQEILDMGWDYGPYNFVLTGAGASFAIYCTVVDYFIIAGSREFVLNCVHQDIEMARKKFLEFLNSYRSLHERNRLQAVLELYS